MRHNWKIAGGCNGNGAYVDGEWVALRKVCSRCEAERWAWKNCCPTSGEYGKTVVVIYGNKDCQKEHTNDSTDI